MGSVEQGALNAIRTCMGVRIQDRVLIVTDREQEEVGAALRKAATDVAGSSNVRMFVLEELAPRPLSKLPQKIERAIPWATVTLWASSSLPGELSARGPFIRKAIQNARHGHMPGITAKIMEQGMCADYDQVYDLTHKIYEITKKASKIEIRNDLGVSIVAEFDKTWRWVPSDGRYHEKGRWGNLPEGEAFTAPKLVSGHFVTNLLGDWFSEKYGNFEDPLSFDVKGSRVDFSTIHCENKTLRDEITRYLKTDENSDRASEFALPTNPLLISSPTIGNLLQDEKARPHVAFGDPYQHETGAPWASKTHVDLLLERCDAFVDGTEIMRRGSYIV
ncbi:MAG: aminopeptidase [Nitrososphaerota archaeon]|nr:aminopeptidase [Nitrososphaerota archaeon]MDG7024113.1 aminopeptidase [Nitrososphaerota archaeon]